MAALARPIPLAALALTAGIAWAAAPLEFRPEHAVLPSLVAALGLLLAGYFLRVSRSTVGVGDLVNRGGSPTISRPAGAALALTFFALGIVAVLRTPHALDSNEDRLLTVVGRVDRALLDLPAVLRPSDGRPARFVLEHAQAISVRGSEPLPGALVIEVPVSDRLIPRGSIVELTARVRPLRDRRNPGEEDSVRRRLLMGTVAVLEASSSRSLSVLSKGSGPLAWLDRLRQRLLRGLGAHLAPRNAALAAALLFGERGGLDDSLLDSAAAAGVLHVLAISGAHVALLVVVLRGLLALGFGPALSDAIAIVVALIYADLAGADSPVARAAIGSALYLFGCLIGRHPRPFDALAVAWIALLLGSPGELFAPGFELSFVACGALLMARLPTGSFAAPRSWWSRLVLYTFRALAPSIVASLATIPLVLHHFGYVSPLAPILTLLVTPLFLLAFAGTAALAIAIGFPGGETIAAPLAKVIDPVLGWLDFAFRHCDELPGAAFHWPRPAWGATLLALLALALVATPSHSMPLPLRMRGRPSLRPMRLAAFALLLAAALEFARFQPPQQTELWLFDVGHGQAALLRRPDRTNILFDAGARGASRFVSATIGRSLDAIGVRSIQLAFVTHGDSDHLNALPSLLRDGRIEGLVHGPGFDAPLAIELLERAHQAGVETIELARGETALDDGLWSGLRILAPQRPVPGSFLPAENDRSLVIEITIGTQRVLIPGDIESAGIRELLALEPHLTAYTVVLPHHGHDDPWLPALLDRLGGRNGALWLASRTAERGTERVLDLASRWQARYFSTARHGALHIVFPENGTTPEMTVYARRNRSGQPSTLSETVVEPSPAAKR